MSKYQNFKNSTRNNANKASSVRALSIWIYGKYPVLLALQKKRREIFSILATKNSVGDLESFLLKSELSLLKSKIKLVDNNYIDSLIGKNHTHQGFALHCSILPLKSQSSLLLELAEIKKNEQGKLPPLLIMDQLHDPHNIGAIIRSACAFGVKRIILPEHNFPQESSVMNKSSSGMIENVDLYLVINISNLMERLKEIGYWCIGLASEAKDDIDKIKNFTNVVLIVGSEGDGIRSLIKKNCDLLVKIPMNSEVESLNASVAASIALREISAI